METKKLKQHPAIPKKRKKLWLLMKVGLAFTFVAAGLVWYTSHAGSLARFQEFCRSLHRDYPIAVVRDEAWKQGYTFDTDPEPTGFHEDPVVVIRPNPEWPMRFGCRFRVHQGRIGGPE